MENELHKLSEWKPENERKKHIEGLSLEELKIIRSYLIPHHEFDFRLDDLFKKICREIRRMEKDAKK